MKKITLLLSLVALASGAASAQPVIHNNDMLLTGDYVYKNTYFSQGVHSPGNAGADITWDFSQMPDSFESHVVTGVCPGADICDDFPDANHYSHLAEAAGNPTGSYTMYDATSNYFNMIGSSNSADAYYHATDPETVYKFPITYGQTYSDHYQLSNGIATQQGYITYKADGYGTIITPQETYHNVLRYKIVRIDTMITSGSFSVSTTTGYSWLKAGIGVIAAFSVNDILSPVEAASASTFSYTTQSDMPSGVNEVDALNDQINIYPNPTGNGNINIECDGLTVRSVVLADMTGKILLKKVIAKPVRTIHIKSRYQA